MKEFEFCAKCSKAVRLSEDIGLNVYVGAKAFVFEFVLLVEDGVLVPLYRWVYCESFKERVFKWDLEGEELEAEENDFFREVEEFEREKREG